MAVNSVRDLCQAENLVAFFIFRSLLHTMSWDRQNSIVDRSWGDRNGPCIYCHPEQLKDHACPVNGYVTRSGDDGMGKRCFLPEHRGKGRNALPGGPGRLRMRDRSWRRDQVDRTTRASAILGRSQSALGRSGQYGRQFANSFRSPGRARMRCTELHRRHGAGRTRCRLEPDRAAACRVASPLPAVGKAQRGWHFAGRSWSSFSQCRRGGSEAASMI